MVNTNLVNKGNGDVISLIQHGQLFPGKMSFVLGSLSLLTRSPLTRMGNCSMWAPRTAEVPARAGECHCHIIVSREIWLQIRSFL